VSATKAVPIEAKYIGTYQLVQAQELVDPGTKLGDFQIERCTLKGAWFVGVRTILSGRVSLGSFSRDERISAIATHPFEVWVVGARAVHCYVPKLVEVGARVCRSRVQEHLWQLLALAVERRARRLEFFINLQHFRVLQF